MTTQLLLLIILANTYLAEQQNTDSCKWLTLVESIPDGLDIIQPHHQHMSTTDAWLYLLSLTNTSLDIAAFYFDLRADPAPGDGSDIDGHQIYSGLHDKGIKLKSAGGKIRVAQNVPNEAFPDVDSMQLAKDGAIELKYVDFQKLIGQGILHTKLWISDKKHFYLGSANMDWQSLRQVKELGIIGIDCPIVALDLQKIFDVYWYLTEKPIPHIFPSKFETQYNMNNHMRFVEKDNSSIDTYIVTSPPSFCPKSRTDGIDGLLHVLNSAEKYIHIEVMEYFPALIYTDPNTYWPIIDDALRSAVFDRGVKLHLLAGLMPHNNTRPDEMHYLSSLAALNGSGPNGDVIARLKLFIVPAYTPAQAKLQFARLNHAKFVATDKHMYVSTSNWSGDYFTSTGGISMVMSYTGSCAICKEIDMVFDRDWNSKYVHELPILRKHDEFKHIVEKYSNFTQF